MADNDDGRIVTERRGDLFLIAIDRPEKLNGFTPKMSRELAEAYTAYEDDDDARCAVLHANGDNFTAGLDLPKMAPHMKAGGELWPSHLIDPFDLRPPLRKKPVIAAVHGWCLTLGIELMLAADLTIAAGGTRFAQLEVKRGLMATGGATLRMVERAGWGAAMRYLLTGDEFDAETALRLGFVEEIVPRATLMATALERAQSIADQAPLAVRATRVSARQALREGWPAAIAEFRAIQTALLDSEDIEEGIRSFKDKRPARFRGR